MKQAKRFKIKRLLAGILAAALVLPVGVNAAAGPVLTSGQTQGVRADATVEKTLKLWYDEPAPNSDTGWEQWSIPLGCGYMGANVFGLTDTERIQLTENSLCGNNGFEGGLNNFSETYLDFGHDYSGVSNYTRDLILNDATAHVRYDYGGVTYSREYFTSYPDKVMAIRLSASESGKLDFTLRPTIPYRNEKKSGTVSAQGDTITLSGRMHGYEVDFEGQYKVIPLGSGASLQAANDANSDNGTIQVTGADSAVILIAIGTNYEFDPQVFLNPDATKLQGFEHPHAKVTERIEQASAQTYEQLRSNHTGDYKNLFDRTRFDLGGAVPEVTTDELMNAYKAGSNDRYLEELYFQYGRYLLISSSRKGALPPNLQGVWNMYEQAPWTAGYWHNINIQMNYWPVFSTNLAELFDSYIDYYDAYLPAVRNSSNQFIAQQHPDNYDPSGDNGWSIGTGAGPYSVYAPNGQGTDGNGTGALMAQVFWDYYDFTRDPDILENVTYPAVSGAANFMSRVMEPHGDYLLADPSASPEQMENGNYVVTVGTAWDQQLAYQMEQNTLEAAELLGRQDEALPQRLADQIGKLDPVQVGFSGQIKEFREENFYGEIAEYNHRHISQLVGLYPGTLINSTTPAWMDAAKVSLNLRGDKSTGWAMAHRLNAWARTKDGNRTYSIYQTLLKNGTLNNLWDTHPPFQIDGNFGGTAGVSEMLLQSHEGYIAPLPAIPEAWAQGSYRGLVARGNFAVGADWSNGQADQFTITSNAGGVCKLSYYNIASAAVTDSDGNPVSFDQDGTDLISFDTVQGKTYTVTQIPSYRATQAASDLELHYLDNGQAVVMNWTASPDAKSYNIYRADGNDADYTLLESGVTDTSYTSRNAELDQKEQHTFRVTAVGQDGRESSGVTAIMFPLSPSASVSGVFLDETTVQLSIDPVASAEQYNIYRKTADGYEKLMSTKYSTAVVGNVSVEDAFAVSVESETRESPKTDAVITSQITLDNVLQGKAITSTRPALGDYPLSNALDGNPDTRYALPDEEGPYSVTIDLDGVYELHNFKILEFQNPPGETRSNETTIELSSDGGTSWTTVIDKQSLNPGSGLMGITEFDLGGAAGSLMRITFHHTIGTTSSTATIHEIICSGSVGAPTDKQALQEVLFQADRIDTSSYDPSAVSAFEDTYQRAALLFNNPAAGQEQVDSITAELANSIKNLKQVNVAFQKPITANHEAIDPFYGIDKMVDGDHESRYAGPDIYTELEVEIDLQGSYLVNRVNVEEYLDGGTRGGETTIQVYSGTDWVTVVDKQPLSGQRFSVLSFDETEGSRIKIQFQNTQSQRLITIYEIEVMGLPQLDLSALEAKVQEAETVEPASCTPESYQRLVEAVASAKEVLENAASQQQVDQAVESLQSAIDALEPAAPADKTILQKVIGRADELIQGEEYASAVESVQMSFAASLASAKEINVNRFATQQQVDNAWIALMTEIHKLGFQKGDLTSLRTLCEYAAGLQLDRYVDNQAKADLPGALAAGQAVLKDGDAMADTIDPAVDTLLGVLTNLRLKADKTYLKQALDRAQSIDLNDYSTQSIAAFQRMVKYGQRINCKDDATQEEVDAAAKQIDAAIAALSPVQRAAGDGLQAASQTQSSPRTGEGRMLPGLSVLLLAAGLLLFGKHKRRE